MWPRYQPRLDRPDITRNIFRKRLGLGDEMARGCKEGPKSGAEIRRLTAVGRPAARSGCTALAVKGGMSLWADG